MPDKPRRRWHAFSLRTLFIVMTLACVWLGWEYNVSRERHRVRAWVEAHGGRFSHRDRYRVNLFDDWQENHVYVPDEFSDEEFAKVERTFPESRVFQRRRLASGTAVP